MHLKKGYTQPDYLLGYDTETRLGSIMTHQFVSSQEAKIEWVNDANVLDNFLKYLENFSGYVIVYIFNAQFDLALLLRKYIDLFLFDDFEVEHNGWKLTVFCSRNWHATFHNKRKGIFVRVIDIHNFFSGSLEKVSETFQTKQKKLEKPEGLGYEKFTHSDKQFVEYALMDARLCREIGISIVKIHEEFDIPVSSSAANLAEKVFRRSFIKEGMRIKFSPFSATRLAEISYHGGKNGYYLDSPTLIKTCYEYDFNAAYGYAMYSLPSFLSGKYKMVDTFIDGKVGVYQATGTVYPCRYGILYDTRFNYFRTEKRQKIKCFVTSFELEEAIRSGEFKLSHAKGWIWKPDTTESPLREYAKYFWEKKNTTNKGDVRYLFYKLCLNSLYGKWIQRNPKDRMKFQVNAQEKFSFMHRKAVAGGLYHPFIASLITGMTRARLHKAEHFFNAIECSTDSVKSREFKKTPRAQFGAMQLERFKCPDCKKEYKTFTGLFIRNRLNLLLDRSEHILKAALHGFWGKPDLLKQLWKEKRTDYEVDRMPLIREGLKHRGKSLFQFYSEERTLKIDWDAYKEIR